MSNPTRIVFERGVELLRENGDWKIDMRPAGARDQSVSPDDFAAQFQLRPIFNEVVVQGPSGERTRRWLLSPSMNGERLEPLISEWISQAGRSQCSSAFLPVFYVLRAIQYHTIQIADHYASERRTWLSLLELLGYDSPIRLSAAAHWFEFDAGVSAARRVYDALRYPIWQAYGSGSTPRNFLKTVKSANKLHECLRDRLNFSWEQHGKKLTECRDCIMHITPMDPDVPAIIGDHRPDGLFRVSAWLPDNPETKSVGKFTYENRTDACTYLWETADELLNLVKQVFDEIVHNT